MIIIQILNLNIVTIQTSIICNIIGPNQSINQMGADYVSSTKRLILVVSKVTGETKIDLFMINLTRSQGEGQSFKDLFSAIEEIVDGYCVDVMYGKYIEAVFDAPLIIVFTNERISNYLNYLSKDRWGRLVIDSDKNLQEWPLDISEGITPCFINTL